MLRVGFLRSASTMRTDFPALAMVCARFMVTVVFPSACPALVMRMTRNSLSRNENWILVRRVRNASANREFGG